MGLDQYAYATYKKIRVKTVLGVVVDKTKENRKVDFAVWRKHPALQEWMEQLYHKKGGKEQVFNCVPVQLTLQDINALENAVRGNHLPHTTGFFFGEDQPEDELLDLEFIKQARDYIEKGWKVFYTSWW